MHNLRFMAVMTMFMLLAFALADEFGRLQKQIDSIEPTVQIVFLNPGQLQALLNVLDPNSPIKVDYIPRKETETKWNRVWNNASAAPHFEEPEHGE